MKMNWKLPLALATVLFSLIVCASRAQDNPPIITDTNSLPTDGLTNDVVTMKELMTSNNIVTNTVKMVLIKISPGLWAGKYEVTQDAYQKIMHGNPSAFRGGALPVDSVSWNDAMAFCGQLTTTEQKTDLPKGYSYTLPTEDQWQMLMADASLKDAVMKLNGDYSSTAPVGSLGANSLGLYDTRGNVMEWCLDSHDPSAYHVLHGGAWDTFIEVNARPEFREYGAADVRKNDYGFRVILTGPASFKP